MPIVRRKLEHEYRFTQIPNEWLRDSRLSLKAKGLLGQLLSHAEGWNVTIGSLAKANGCGRDSVRAAVKELEDAGYLRREQSRATGGEFAEVMWATSEPQTDSPSPDLPSSGKPASVNTTLKKTISKNTNIKNTITKNTYSDSLLDEAFETFWDSYPRKAGKAQARKAFGKNALKHMTEMLDGARRIASDPNLPETQFIPYPATWINREGWSDEAYPQRGGGKMSNAQKNLIEYEKTVRGAIGGEAGGTRIIGSD